MRLRTKHQQELENFSLTSRPFKTLKLFLLAVIQYLRQSLAYLLSHRGWLMLCAIVVTAGILLVVVDGLHEKHVEEVLRYMRFGIWWVALGVASSIGLGSGLHTFVLYLGPHIALFTIKAMQCGRIDIKSALYDTIQLKRGPSWLDKDCAEFGPPLFPSSHGVRIPISSILPQIQLEAILWGLGTALGELPPYFISRAASLSGGKVNTMEELDVSSRKDVGYISSIKRWLLSHAQYLNFFTILVLASVIFFTSYLSISELVSRLAILHLWLFKASVRVPNPLFDLAGIMCGQFGIPFWKFFLATMIGKAIIKTHIQTVFIISVCNNQLLYWIENELIWVLSFVPGFYSVLSSLIPKLHSMKDKYLATKAHVPANIKGKKWDFSLAFIWNTVVWFMLMNFFVKIVNSTAEGYLKKEQENEIAALKKTKSLKQSSDDSDAS
ncbi:meiotic spindle pole body protein Kms1 [Orobanche gracilis]